MGGIFVEAATDKITFVASDAHKLVRYQRSDAMLMIMPHLFCQRNPLHC